MLLYYTHTCAGSEEADEESQFSRGDYASDVFAEAGGQSCLTLSSQEQGACCDAAGTDGCKGQMDSERQPKVDTKGVFLKALGTGKEICPLSWCPISGVYL